MVPTIIPLCPPCPPPCPLSDQHVHHWAFYPMVVHHLHWWCNRHKANAAPQFEQCCFCFSQKLCICVNFVARRCQKQETLEASPVQDDICSPAVCLSFNICPPPKPLSFSSNKYCPRAPVPPVYIQAGFQHISQDLFNTSASILNSFRKLINIVYFSYNQKQHQRCM